MNNPLLSINIICSGRSDTDKCLAALDSVREAIPCELIVTDTGCDSETRAVVEQYADRVIDFDWCNDFAAARNVGLVASHGSWFMYVDDDEYFSQADIADLIGFFTTEEYKKYDCASYIQRNYRDLDRASFSDIAVLRMVKLDEQVRFHGIIHEYLTPVGERHRLIHSHVDHLGYVPQNPEAVQAKAARNIPLLLKMMNAEPDNMRWSAHLAQECRAVGDLQVLYDLCNLMLIKTNDSLDADHIWARNTFFAGRSIGAAGRSVDEKIALIEDALSDPNINGVTRAFLLSYGCELYFKAQMYDKAFQAGKKYLKYYEVYMANPDALAREVVIFTDVTFDDAHLRYVNKYLSDLQ